MINRGGRTGMPSRRVPLVNPRVPTSQPLPPESKNSHELTPKQCVEARHVIGKATKFPPEIVDIVMDFAEYWVCSVTSIDYSTTDMRELIIYSGRDRENQFLLRTEPLGLTKWHTTDHDGWQAAAPAYRLSEEYPREELERFVEGPPSTLEHPFRKIIFDIVSRDQGRSDDYSTYHTFRSSWTWFDAGIDRFDKGHARSVDCTENTGPETTPCGSKKTPTTSAIRPIWPPSNGDLPNYDHCLLPTEDHKIQCNRVAEKDWQHHHIEWSWTDNIDPESSAGVELEANGRGSATGDGSFLRNLKVGDMLTVWGRSRFIGWANHVQKVQVRVYWAL
ncbi:hypothetical protein SAMD00023353_3100200 [Rosellinia necatrix]|uniref:Ankyrin repeat protein n=1 Tax=Rosellinia necatrix TaxID=77044 RepID=A0A1W2TWF7_ROSNE|nr:hypothetical protein SAMD00023353_3100200 [Rosellinia necatrix]